MELINGDFRDFIIGIIERYGDKVIMVSDPPFNIGYKYEGYTDKMEESDYYEMLDKAFSHTPSVVIHYPEALYKLSFHIGKFPERVISWVYNSNTAKQHRDIAFFDVKPDMSQVRQPYKNLQDKRIRQRIEEGKEGAKLYDWWEINQVKNVSRDKTSHPCQMPQEVMDRVIGVLPYDCVVIDPFMGSGTTGVSVIEMNRKQGASRQFVGVELNKGYYDIACKRIYGKEKENVQIEMEGD